MTQFRVLPSWYEHDQLEDADAYEAEYAADAAAEYVRLNHANLDYPSEVEIQTLQYGHKGLPVIRRFTVSQIPAFEAREITHDQPGPQS